MSPPGLRTLRLATLVGLGYLVLAAAAIELTRLSGGIALLWPAGGFLLGVLASVRRGHRPAIVVACVVASCLATIVLQQSLPAALGFGVANALEALLAFALLRRWNGGRLVFEDLTAVLHFVAAAGVAAPVVSGLVAAVSGQLAFGLPFGRTWFDWTAGHGLGALIATPLVTVMATREWQRWRGARAQDWAMSAALLGLVAAVSLAVFAQEQIPLLFLPALPVLLVTFRMGRVGAAAALVIVAMVGGALTLLGHGPVMLVEGSAAFGLQFFQMFLGTLFLLALPPAAMLARQRRLHRRLQRSEAALRLLADNSTDVLLNLDLDGSIRFASTSVRHFGFEPDALIGRDALEMIEPAHRDAVQAAHRAALAAPDTTFTVEYEARRHDGSVTWLETNTRAVRSEDGAVAGVVSAIRDVSHRKSVEHRLQAAADTDALTGLANRRPFVAMLDAAIGRADAGLAAGRGSVVALLDVDHFKGVNDRYGHAAGDAALVALAQLCRRELRGSDTIARLGGEEFGILLAGSGMDEAAAVCERLRAAIAAQPVLAAGAPAFRITASFGLAEVTAGTSGDAVLNAADRALYAAKHAGRNRLKIAA